MHMRRLNWLHVLTTYLDTAVSCQPHRQSAAGFLIHSEASRHGAALTAATASLSARMSAASH